MTRAEKIEMNTLEARVHTQGELIDLLRRDLAVAQQKVTARLDTQMMDQRIKLANALGQMMQQTTEAIRFIIAKEML